MKKLLFVPVALFLTINGFAQEIKPSLQLNKWSYGFNLSLNQFLPQNNHTLYSKVKNNLGFGIGGVAVRSLSKSIEFVPKIQIGFYSAEYEFYNDISGDLEKGTMDRAQIELPLHFNKYFNRENGKHGIYVIAGPSFQYDFVKQTPSSFIQSIDLGIGLLKEYTLFKLAPELRYSYALTNISTGYLYTDFRMHNISLVCNFRG